jgi:hypothetical protein
MLPVSPPIDFPLYGLAGWAGHRWWECYDGELGTPTWGVRLGYQRGTDTYVGIATLPRRRYDEAFHTEPGDLAEVAHYGTHWLINLTLPEPELARPDGFLRALVGRSRAAAARWADWPTVRWSVGDASVWRFAGGWAGFSVLDDVYLVGAGYGVAPEELEFAVVTEGAPYGFDLAAPLRNTDLDVARERTGPPEPAWCNREAWHVDQVALMGDQRPSR